MPKKAATKQSKKSATLPPLNGVQQEVMTYVMNSIAFENYADCCSVDDMAAKFKRTPGRFMTTLRKLVASGYLTIKGETFPWVFPTVAALRSQDKNLSEAEAKKILAKIQR